VWSDNGVEVEREQTQCSKPLVKLEFFWSHAIMGILDALHQL
jgi:hypothetical protein